MIIRCHFRVPFGPCQTPDVQVFDHWDAVAMRLGTLRRAGWQLDEMDGRALCPACAKPTTAARRDARADAEADRAHRALMWRVRTREGQEQQRRADEAWDARIARELAALERQCLDVLARTEGRRVA